MNNSNFAFIWRMAWRDSRRNRSRLLLFTASIVLGIAALVAINSFSVNLQEDIEGEAKELLGADFSLQMRQAPDSSLQILIDSLANLSEATAREISFASMLYFPPEGQSRLAQVRALEGDFPFYGELETAPANQQNAIKKNGQAIIDQTLLLQFKRKVGDQVKVGGQSFEIAAQLVKAPGQNGIASTVAPRVYIPLKNLDETGLVQKGSRLEYSYYFKLKPEHNPESIREKIGDRLTEQSIRLDTVAQRKERLGEIFYQLTRFFNLIAFIALLLGCVGVASAVQVYIKEKIATVAVLRCLGMSGRQAFLIYLLQIGGMGLIGASIGAAIGSLMQVLLPVVLQDFLPLEVSFGVVWSAVAEGILVGFLISILFALLPLIAIRKVSPLRTLRASYEEAKSRFDFSQILVYLLIILFISGFTYWQIRDWTGALSFSVAVLLSFGILWLVAKLLMWGVKRFFPVSWNYLWRQSMANLYRPNNQTIILIISIGLGTALISTMYLIQALLIQQVALSDENNQPNMVLFDIQNPQRDEINKFTKSFDLPVLQQEPIVAMTLAEYNGKTRNELLEDTTENRLPRDIVRRTYRVTYRDSLVSNETIREGKFQTAIAKPGDTVWVSVSSNHARRMGVKIGDEVVFDVQGRRLKTYIGSIRDLDLGQFRTSFTFVFPRGVLEKAPQFHVLITRVNSEAKSAEFQRALLKKFPNVSVVDISLILKTAEEILAQISFVIQFMALFCILTGLVVLVASVMISKYQRVQEAVLLRTIGASRRQILWINALEYFFLGSLASLTGIGLAILGSWALSEYSFKIPFRPDWLPLLWLYLSITALAVIIGLLNIRGILNRPPLEVLRREV